MRLIHDRPSGPAVRTTTQRPRLGRPRSGRGDTRRSVGPLLVRGLEATLTTAGWVPMDAHTMDQGGGFQMPAQMMPGAPEGDQMRLGVPITLVSTDGTEQRFNLAEEFAVIGRTGGGPVPLHSDDRPQGGNEVRTKPAR